MELLVIAIVAAIVLLVLEPMPIWSHGGFFPFEGVEMADQVDRDVRANARSDRRHVHHGPSGPRK